MAAVGVIPAVLLLAGPSRRRLPLLELHGLFYSVTFGLVALTDAGSRYRAGELAIQRSLEVTLVGMILMLLGYYLLGGALFWGVRGWRVLRVVQPSRLLPLAWSAEAVHMLGTVLPLRAMPTVGPLLDKLHLLSLAVLLTCWLRGDLGRQARTVLLWGLVPFLVVKGLVDAVMASALGTALLAMLVYYRERQRIPLVAGALCVTLFALYQPIKDAYRSQTWAVPEAPGPLERVRILAELGASHWAAGGSPRHAEDAAVTRLDHLGTMSAIVDATPRQIPYWDGETLANLGTSWIPRILWPQKPLEDLGNSWARTYGLLYRTDFVTSYNLPWLPELYMNFGPMGVALGMLLIGAALRFLATKFGGEDTSDVGFLIGLSLTSTLWYAESNLSLMWGSLLTQWIALTVLLTILFGRGR